MKKALRLLPILMGLVLGACNVAPSSASSSNTVTPSNSDITSESSIPSSSSDEVTSSSSISSSSEISSSSSSSSSSSVNPLIEESKWGKEAATACFDALGVVFPYLEADAFEYKVTTDDYGDKAVWFYLYFDSQETAEAKIVDYAWAAYEQDRYECVVKPTRFMGEDYSVWEQNVLYADKVLSEKYAVELQALASLKSYNGKITGCLGIYGFSYIPNVDPTKFPTYPVEYVLGPNNGVPALEVDDVKYDFAIEMYNGNRILIMIVTSDKHTIEMEEEYFYNLVDAHYKIYRYDDLADDFTGEAFSLGNDYPEYEDNYCYYAYNKDNTHVVYFEYDLSNQYLRIEIMPLSGQAE